MTDLITVTVEDIVTVIELPSQDIVYINDASIPGPKGEPGASPTRSSYNHENVSLVSGTLTLDASNGSSFFVTLTESVSSVNIDNWPPAGQSQVLRIYFQQDSNGSHNITGWPAGTKWNQGTLPVLTSTGHAIDCIVLDSFDQGNTIFATMVGYNYS
jgi:hypothetical protein